MNPAMDSNATPGRALRIVIADPACFSPPYDHSLCQALTAKGCDVTLACSRLPEGLSPFQGSYRLWDHFYECSQRFATARPPALRKLVKAIDHAWSWRRFVAWLEENPPDILHMEWLALPFVDAHFLRRLRCKMPLVLTLHNTTVFHGTGTSRLQGLGLQRALACFDRVIVHTQYSVRQVAEKDWLPPDRLSVIPHGVLDYYAQLPPSSAVAVDAPPNDPPRLLLFGSLKPYKGVDVLLRAFAALPSELKRAARLWIVGDPGMQMDLLVRLAQDLGIDSQVDWEFGYVAERRIPELFRRSAALILPYREIDQSGVLMTALAFNRPIIATRIGGIPEVIEDGRHGFLVSPENIPELTAAIARLLRDSAAGLQMGEEVRRLGSGPYSWSAIAQQTLELYRQVLAPRGR